MMRFLIKLYRKVSMYIILIGFYTLQFKLVIYHVKLDTLELSEHLDEYEKSLYLDNFSFLSFLTQLFTPDLIDSFSEYSSNTSSRSVNTSNIFVLNKILSKNDVYLLDVEYLIEFKKELTNSLETNSFSLTNFLKLNKTSLISYGINIKNSLNFLKDLKFTNEINCNITPVFSDFFDQKILASIYVKFGLLIIHVAVMYDRGNFLWTPKDEFQVNGLVKLFSDKPRAFSKFETIEIIDKGFQMVKIPKNIDQFLFDYKHSEFVECDLAAPLKNFSNNIGLNYKYDRIKEISISKNLVYVISVLEYFFKDYSLSSYILNGWFADCEINPSLKTIDLILDGYHFDPQLLDHLRNDKKLPFSQLNFDNQTLEIKMFESGQVPLSLKFSFEYNKTHRWLYSKHENQIVKNFVRNYEPLCSAELMRAKILVPCDTSKYINEKNVLSESIIFKKLVDI